MIDRLPVATNSGGRGGWRDIWQLFWFAPNVNRRYLKSHPREWALSNGKVSHFEAKQRRTTTFQAEPEMALNPNKVAAAAALLATIALIQLWWVAGMGEAKPSLAEFGIDSKCLNESESDACKRCCLDEYAKSGKLIRWDGTNIGRPGEASERCKCYEKKTRKSHDDYYGSDVMDGREIGLYNNL